MQDNDAKEIDNLAWREKVYIETPEFIIIGYIFMPQIGKKNRLLSEVLNSGKKFLAVKSCILEYKLHPEKSPEQHDFMQVNITSILIMRPHNER